MPNVILRPTDPWRAAQRARAKMQTESPVFRALAVEDDAAYRRFVSVMLRWMGCEVEAALTGIQAVERASEDFGIIFMDLCVPIVDGFDASRRIRSLPGAAGPDRRAHGANGPRGAAEHPAFVSSVLDRQRNSAHLRDPGFLTELAKNFRYTAGREPTTRPCGPMAPIGSR